MRNYRLQNIGNAFRSTSAPVQLIVINALVFLLGNLAVNLISSDLLQYLALPSNLRQLPARFYTIFTYMFTHVGMGHIFFNMIYLFSMGQIFVSLLGARRLWFVYIAGGLAGGLIYLILYNTLFSESSAILLGASASITAVAIATAVYAPNMPVHLFIAGPFPLKWVVIVFFALRTLIDLSDNTGGKVSHIGGALFGLFYALRLKSGRDLSGIFSAEKVKKLQKKSKLKVYYSEQQEGSLRTDERLLNDLLDKINRSGYDSLTDQEKKTLQRISSGK